MILYSRWCALSLPTRIKIAEAFGIEKKGATEVASNVLKHDGYLIEDIEKLLTAEAIQKYLQAENTDLTQLWTMLVDKIEGREVEGLIQSAIAPALTVLPEKEVKQFKKEHKERMKKVKTSVKKVIKKKNVKKA